MIAYRKKENGEVETREMSMVFEKGRFVKAEPSKNDHSALVVEEGESKGIQD